jgi:hypothetical protein
VSDRQKKWLHVALVWGLVIGGYVFLTSTVLPGFSESGYAGDVLERNAIEDSDASALFYTESDRTWEIMRGVRER